MPHWISRGRWSVLTLVGRVFDLNLWDPWLTQGKWESISHDAVGTRISMRTWD
jgi:hypothetical protein